MNTTPDEVRIDRGITRGITACVLVLAMAATMFVFAARSYPDDGTRDGVRSRAAALIAVELAFVDTEVIPRVPPLPSPLVPTPAPGDVCPNCRGKGTLGDGTIKVTCPECDGTGRKKRVAARNPLLDTPHSGGRWTHPGDIRSHLINSHGYTAAQLAGLTSGQMLYLHDSAHEGARGGGGSSVPASPARGRLLPRLRR